MTGSGGFRDALGRAFSDDPLSWAVPLYRAWRIRVRVHVVFVIFVIAELIYALLTPQTMGIGFMALAMGALFVIVLLHEYGHCIACRSVGGEADEILMWPLGGLASCMPPETPRAHLITTLGGPAVNVLLIVPTTVGVLFAGGGVSEIIFNPFAPGETIAQMNAPTNRALWTLIAVWWVHYLNLVLLGFNVLLPMFPLDGGRIVQALVWMRAGREPSLRISTTVGLVCAVCVLVVAMVASQTMLMGIAIFAGIVCWIERRRLDAVDELGGPAIDLSAAFEHPDRIRDDELDPRRDRTRPKQERLQRELDRILAKIADTGMDSLTARERRVLRRETARRRRTQG